MAKKKKLAVIVSTNEILTKEKRRSYKKDHPGERLSFALRFPNFPLYVSIISLLLVIASVFLHGTLR